MEMCTHRYKVYIRLTREIYIIMIIMVVALINSGCLYRKYVSFLFFG